MYLRIQVAKSILIAGIPLLQLPFLAKSGMSRDDRSQREDLRGLNAIQQSIEGKFSNKKGEEITSAQRDGKGITFRINDQTNQLCPKGTQTLKTSHMSKGFSGNQDSGMDQGNSTGNSSGQNQMAQGSSANDSSNSCQTSSSNIFRRSSGQQDVTVLAQQNFLHMIVPSNMKGLTTKIHLTGLAKDHLRMMTGIAGMDSILAAGKEITIIPATGTTGTNPARTNGITMILKIVEVNGPCIPKVAREITKVPWNSCLIGTTPQPAERL